MILGVIPARAGSKGVRQKNIKIIAGKPLLAWTIEAAKKSKLLGRLIVSTEDDAIAGIACGLGVEVLKRPRQLATDSAPMIKVLRHVLSKIDADLVVLLQPTSPVRNDGLIDRCIRRFKKTGADSLATGFTCQYTEYGTNVKRRQELKGFFYDDGSVYVIKSGLIKTGRLFGKKLVRFYTTPEQNIDIDEEFNFWVAEQALLRRKKGRK